MSKPSLQQVDRQPWPSGAGKIVGVIRLEPQDLVERYGLAFFEDFDNLDRYVAAAIRLPSGRIIGLLRHRGHPFPGVEVYADSLDDVGEVQAEVESVLGEQKSLFQWKPGP